MSSENLEKSSQELIYTVLGHSGLETSRIPLNPNSLSFTNREIDDKFTHKLINEKGDGHRMSETLKNNLVMFYTALALFTVIVLVTAAVMCYERGSESENSFEVRVVAVAGVDCAALGVLFAIIKVSHLRWQLRRLFLYLMLFFNSYLVLTDQRVLSKLLNEELAPEHVNHPLIIVLFLYLYSWVSFSHFIGTLVVSAFTLILFLCCELYAGAHDRVVIVSEFLFLSLFCALICFRTHQTEFRARHLFWRLEKEENAVDMRIEVVDRRHSAGHALNTERERLIELCESIKKKIKAAAAVVIYQDIKIELKTAGVEIEKVRRQLAIGHLNEVVRFDQDIDAEDREFIYQQFYSGSTSHPGTSQRLTLADRKASVVNMSDFGAVEVDNILSEVGTNWNFDVWELYKSTGHSIALTGKYLFQKWDFNAGLCVAETVTDNFFKEIEKGYLKNPYHNACHGADVCHSLMYFIEKGALLKSLTSIELGSSIIAALGHDIGHPGVTNRFLVANRDKVAIRYNDASVLENMHVSQIYKILEKPELNILKSLPMEDWVSSRKCIIEMVLHTDMSKHFETLGQFRARSHAAGDIDLQRTDDKYFVLSMGLKCADLAHSAKALELHQHWTELVCEEFFNQGALEKERGQTVSMYCDRDTTDIPKSQAGFLKNICIPLFEAWLDYLESDEANHDCLDQQKANLTMWESTTRVRKSIEAPGKDTVSPGTEKPYYCKRYLAVVFRPPPLPDGD